MTAEHPATETRAVRARVVVSPRALLVLVLRLALLIL